VPIVPIGFQSAPGQTLGVSARRLSDGWLFDHADGTFRETPTARLASLPEGTGPDAGAYELRLATDPAEWPDDYYQFTIHDTAGDARVVGMMVAWIPGGDGLAPPAAGGSGGGGSGPVTIAPASVAAIAAAVGAGVVHGGLTRDRLLWAAAASGGGGVAINEATGAVTIRGPDQGSTCITAQVTYPGNRTVTLNFPF
jgi:hypothetical protein